MTWLARLAPCAASPNPGGVVGDRRYHRGSLAGPDGFRRKRGTVSCRQVHAPALLAALVAVLFVTSVAGTAQIIDPVLNGEALVRLVPGADIDAFNARYQTTTLESIPSRKIYRLQLPPEADPQQFKQEADADSDTVWVELNYAGQVAEARGRCFYTLVTPDAKGYLTQPARQQIGLPAAHQFTTGGDIVVAIVDSGIDATHIALAGLVLDTGWNFVERNANTADIGNDQDDDGDGEIDEMTGHGTHVAGVVAMVAPTAWLLPIRVIDSDGNTDNFRVAAGIFYAVDHGVDVINVSIGSTYDSAAVVDAIAEATAAGIPVAAAAGNVNVRTPEEYPALNAGVLGVVAVDASDIKSTFSNYHESLAISAPGSAIISTLPGNLFAAWDGTSMAAPMVTGVAALVLSRHPEWPRDASRANNVHIAIMQSAVNIDPLNPPFAGMLGAGRISAIGAIDVSAAFTAATAYAAGPAPESLVAADFNGDGLLDIVAGNTGADTVSVLRNDGFGAFAAPAPVNVGGSPLALAADDFDGDGRADLAVVLDGSDAVWILRNDGTGALGPPAPFVVSAGPRALAAGRFVSGTAVDLAVACADANVVAILRNQGGGGFAPHANVPVGQRPYDVRIGDVDGDGLADLVTADRDADAVSVVRNIGGGAFAPAVSYAVGSDPRALTLGDFDGDGDLDIATANHDARDITVLWNNGSGGFGPPHALPLHNARRPIRLDAADLDCDGDSDLVATGTDDLGAWVTILLSRGDQTFVQPLDYPVAADPRGVIAADLDGDHDPDLAVAASAADVVSVLLNRGCAALHRGDMNCDGAVDFDDVDPFVVALSDPALYEAQFAQCERQHADCNADGRIDFDDIDPFVALLGG